MGSNKIHISEPVRDILEQLAPDAQALLLGAFKLLQDELVRDTQKFDLNRPTEDGKVTWGIAAGRAWIAFVEEDDDSVTVIHGSILSRFQPPRIGNYGFGA